MDKEAVTVVMKCWGLEAFPCNTSAQRNTTPSTGPAVVCLHDLREQSKALHKKHCSTLSSDEWVGGGGDGGRTRWVPLKGFYTLHFKIYIFISEEWGGINPGWVIA